MNYKCECCGENLHDVEEIVVVRNDGGFKRISDSFLLTTEDVVLCETCYIEELDSINYSGISKKYMQGKYLECYSY